ncbi:MAG: hypothetical protein ACRAVC_18145 [Trichormus sp.]
MLLTLGIRVFLSILFALQTAYLDKHYNLARGKLVAEAIAFRLVSLASAFSITDSLVGKAGARLGMSSIKCIETYN